VRKSGLQALCDGVYKCQKEAQKRSRITVLYFILKNVRNLTDSQDPRVYRGEGASF